VNGGGVGATVANRRIAATSSAALPKSPYLTPMIWGPSYVVAIEPVRDEQNMRQPEEIAIWEAGPLAVSRHWFATIQPGDDAAIAAVLASLAELADMGTRHPDRRRGRALPKALAARPGAFWAALWRRTDELCRRSRSYQSSGRQAGD